MHILYIFGYKYTLETWFSSGALERELKFFNKMWEDYKISYTLITYGCIKDLNIDLPKNVNVIPMFPTSVNLKSTFSMFVNSFLFPLKTFRSLDKIDLIRTNQLNGSWLAILFKLLLKKPLYLRTGFDQYLFAKYDKKNKLKILFFYLLTKLSLKICDIYTSTSESDINFLTQTFNNKDKVFYRPNWVDLKNNPKSINKREYKFMSAGRLEDQKNFQLIINAFSDAEDEITIIGNGSKKYYLVELAKVLKVKLNMISNLSHNSFISKLENAKFFILASTHEGNPKVLLEAMSLGCIPIVSDIKNHTEIIQNGINGFTFKNNDLESLKLVLNKVVKLKNINEISENSFNHVKINNSLNNLSRKEYEDYLQLLS